VGSRRAACSTGPSINLPPFSLQVSAGIQDKNAQSNLQAMLEAAGLDAVEEAKKNYAWEQQLPAHRERLTAFYKKYAITVPKTMLGHGWHGAHSNGECGASLGCAKKRVCAAVDACLAPASIALPATRWARAQRAASHSFLDAGTTLRSYHMSMASSPNIGARPTSYSTNWRRNTIRHRHRHQCQRNQFCRPLQR